MNKILLVLMMIPIIGIANPNPGKFQYEKSKTLKKEYNVNADALVSINNKYGNVDVITWNQNRVVIEVKITVNGNSEDKVLSKLDDITVDFDGSKSHVSAKTIIEKSSSGWFNWSSSNVNFQIDYKVNMPVTNKASLYNDYGSISLNELKGKAEINCDYGKIMIGSLFHKNNEINIDYTNNSVIEFMNGGSINADYSGFTVEKAKNIDLNADYTSSGFENIENLAFNCDYGKLAVDNGNSVSGNGDYLTMRFGTIFKKLMIEADYGSIRVEELKPVFERVSIDSDYTGIKMGIDPDASFDYVIQLSYGGFSNDLVNVTNLKKIVKSSSKYYEGFVKKQNSGASINIDTEYGAVKLYNN